MHIAGTTPTYALCRVTKNIETLMDNQAKAGTERRAVVVGASSGIGYQVARELLREGWRIGVAARHTERLHQLAREYEGRVSVARIDVTRDEAAGQLLELVDAVGGMELYLHVAGVGWQNPELLAERELPTVETNAMGFARLVGVAYRYFAARGGGHIAVVSSIAGTKGLGAAPAYSASKAFQNVYIEALAQQARMRRLPICFTDVRPGFVQTSLLGDGRRYPMLMQPERVAQAIVKAVRARRSVCVIDWRYRVLTALWRLIPYGLWRRMTIRN